MTRTELLFEMEVFQPLPLNAVDTILHEDAGTVVHRTIPYHPEHQPAEPQFREIKDYVYDGYNDDFHKARTEAVTSTGKITGQV